MMKLVPVFEGFAGTNQGKSTATPKATGGSAESSRVETKKSAEGTKKREGCEVVVGKSKDRTATDGPDHDAEEDYETGESYTVDTRSSGSGESTPVGSIIQSRNKKTDPYRGYTDLRSDSILSSLTNRSINEDETILEDSSDDLNESDENASKKKGTAATASSTSNSRSNFPHFTMHLDQISGFDEEEGNASFSSELNHVR
jgi:hypothetical protein